MTRQELEQYIDLKKEIKYLEDKIKELQQKEKLYSKDVVRGSSTEYPYTSKPIVIEGYDEEYDEQIIKSIKRKEIRLKQLVLQSERKAEEIWKFIQGIKEPRIRQMLSMRYIDGDSWLKISMVFKSSNECYARNTCERYLSSLK